MPFGRMGALGALGALGRAGSRPSAPVLAITSLATDNTPNGSLDFDNTVGAGDSVRIQIRVSGAPDWLSPVQDITHVITSPEALALAFDFAFSAVVDGGYEASAFVIKNGVSSPRSNVVSFTVTAVALAFDFSISGSQSWVLAA